MNTKVSVIIPTLNEEKYIASCIHSIKKQTVKPFEIIVADGFSKDKTTEIAKMLGCRIIKVKPIKGINNISLARNQAAKIAKGGFLFFIDADTIVVDENWFRKALYLIKKRRVDAVVGRFGCYDCKNLLERTIIAIWFYLSVVIKLFTRKDFYSGPCGLFVKKSVFESVNGYPLNEFAEDSVITRKIGSKHKIFLCWSCLSKTSARRLRKFGYSKYLKFWLFYHTKRQIIKKKFIPEYPPAR